MVKHSLMEPVVAGILRIIIIKCIHKLQEPSRLHRPIYSGWFPVNTFMCGAQPSVSAETVDEVRGRLTRRREGKLVSVYYPLGSLTMHGQRATNPVCRRIHTRPELRLSTPCATT